MSLKVDVTQTWRYNMDDIIIKQNKGKFIKVVKNYVAKPTHYYLNSNHLDWTLSWNIQWYKNIF